MRVTNATKQRTRDRLIESARELFVEKGFDATTTRDITESANVAAGTLFNYFPSKEELAMTILVEAMQQARDDFIKLRRGDESLAESLFAHIATCLRRLQQHRTYVGPVIESAMSPFASSSSCTAGQIAREEHLSCVWDLLAEHGIRVTSSFVTVHLYWTLYLGVLAFWSRDDSPNQVDTLAVLDQSLQLFAKSITGKTNPTGGER